VPRVKVKAREFRERLGRSRPGGDGGEAGGEGGGGGVVVETVLRSGKVDAERYLRFDVLGLGFWVLGLGRTPSADLAHDRGFRVLGSGFRAYPIRRLHVYPLMLYRLHNGLPLAAVFAILGWKLQDQAVDRGIERGRAQPVVDNLQPGFRV
jgi:hypothetical protein